MGWHGPNRNAEEVVATGSVSFEEVLERLAELGTDDSVDLTLDLRPDTGQRARTPGRKRRKGARGTLTVRAFTSDDLPTFAADAGHGAEAKAKAAHEPVSVEFAAAAAAVHDAEVELERSHRMSDPFAFLDEEEEEVNDEAMLRAIFTANQALVALFAKADRDDDGLVLPAELKKASQRYPTIVDALELPHPDALLAGLEELIPSARVTHGEITEVVQRQRQRPKFRSLLGRARRAPGHGAALRPMREVVLRRTFHVIDRRRTERVSMAEMVAFGRFMGQDWSVDKVRMALDRKEKLLQTNERAPTMLYPPPSRRRPRLSVVSPDQALTGMDLA